MITCHELIEFLCDYLDGELPASSRASFEQHLRLCPPCVEYMRSYRETVLLGRAVCEHEDTHNLPPLPEELVQAILTAMKQAGGCRESGSSAAEGPSEER